MFEGNRIKPDGTGGGAADPPSPGQVYDSIKLASPIDSFLNNLTNCRSVSEERLFKQRLLDLIDLAIEINRSGGCIVTSPVSSELSRYTEHEFAEQKRQDDIPRFDVGERAFIERTRKMASESDLSSAELHRTLSRFDANSMQAAMELLLTIARTQAECERVLGEAIFRELLDENQAARVRGIVSIPEKDAVLSLLDYCIDELSPMSRQRVLEEGLKRNIIDRQEADSIRKAYKAGTPSASVKRRLNEITGWVQLSRGPEMLDKFLNFEGFKR